MTTTISINAELNEALKSVKHQRVDFKNCTKSRMAQVLICEGLNATLGKETGFNYLELLDR